MKERGFSEGIHRLTLRLFLQNEFLTETRGTGVLNSAFHSYGAYKVKINSNYSYIIIVTIFLFATHTASNTADVLL